MEVNITYSGRQIDTNDVIFIKNLINNNPGKSRCFISKELCRLWDWKQRNGYLKDLACRGLLKKLENEGLIIQPPKKFTPNNRFANRKPRQIIDVDKTPVKTCLKNLQPIELRSVRKTKDEKLYNSLIHEYHYLKYTLPVGENYKYIAFSNNRPIGCLGRTSPAWYIGCRDKYIGRESNVRMKNLHLIAYNTGFPVPPRIRPRNLASHLLSLNARIISNKSLKIQKTTSGRKLYSRFCMHRKEIDYRN